MTAEVNDPFDAGSERNAIAHDAMRAVPMALARCEMCGYDIRHDPDGVCPECGTPLTLRQQAALELQGGRGYGPGVLTGVVFLLGIPFIIILLAIFAAVGTLLTYRL